MNKEEATAQLVSVMTHDDKSSLKGTRIEKLMVTYKHYRSHASNQLK